MEAEWIANEYCPSCGWRRPRTTYGCWCAAVGGSAQDRADLIRRAVDGDPVAIRGVGVIRDGDSRTALEAVVTREADRLAVAAAVKALANIAAVESMPVMLERVKANSGDSDTVRYFWRVGTPEAVEVLATILQTRPTQAALPLAKLGDERGVRVLIELLGPESQRFDRSHAAAVAGFPPGPWTTQLLDMFEASADIDVVVERAVDSSLLQMLQWRARQDGLEIPRTLDDWADGDYRVTEAGWIEHERSRERRQRLANLAVLAEIVIEKCGEDGVIAVDRASERCGVELLHFVHTTSAPATAITSGPTISAWALDYELGDALHPGTRFGGQPTWIDSPTWPLNAAGTPMAFWAQFRLPEAPDRMAYLFVDHIDDIISSANGTATVFVQPGGRPTSAWEARSTGPVLPDQVQRDPSDGAPPPWGMAARVPSLRRFDDPTDATRTPEQSWDKIGGHPKFLQGDPAPEGFDFLCQFTAAMAGQELADGAQCYLYMNHQTGAGLFLWDCH